LGILGFSPWDTQFFKTNLAKIRFWNNDMLQKYRGGSEKIRPYLKGGYYGFPEKGV
jgi:hypothetical protein